MPAMRAFLSPLRFPVPVSFLSACLFFLCLFCLVVVGVFVCSDACRVLACAALVPGAAFLCIHSIHVCVGICRCCMGLEPVCTFGWGGPGWHIQKIGDTPANTLVGVCVSTRLVFPPFVHVVGSVFLGIVWHLWPLPWCNFSCCHVCWNGGVCHMRVSEFSSTHDDVSHGDIGGSV